MKLYQQNYFYYILLIFLLNLIKSNSCEENEAKVKLPLGVIEGVVKKTLYGKEIYTFRGVPYAKPPVGELRFEKTKLVNESGTILNTTSCIKNWTAVALAMFGEPQEVEPWSDVLKAKTIYKCLQYSHSIDQYDPDPVYGEEDCLYLSIFTPTLDQNANLNVLFYIHGGAFMFNYGGQYEPDKLLEQQDVVFVNINYRLGPLGFLSTEDDVVPGNMGLKDQIQALKWLKKYIKYFGGNPNSITIAGNSAGAASVHLHYLMPASNGLFHGGISQSGSALNPWVLMEAALDKTNTLANLVGCPTTETRSTKDIINCLKGKTGREIVDTVKHFQPWWYNPFSPFGVVVDTWSSAPLLPDHPYSLLKSKKVYDVPWIVSYTNSEGLYPAAGFYTDENLDYIENNWNHILPHILDYNFTVEGVKQRDAVSQKIRKFYLQNRKVNKETFLDFVKIASDRIFIADIEKAARLQAAANKSPVYMYNFIYRGTYSYSETRSKTLHDFGASHVDDLVYILYFGTDTSVFDNDQKITDIMVKIWTSFMDSRKPQAPIEWIPVKPTGKISYLQIASPKKVQIVTDDELGNQSFWNNLPLKENKRLILEKDEL